jgi:pheromone shutdown protein TraB
MTLADVLPAVRQLSAIEKLKLIQILARDLETAENITSLESQKTDNKTYYVEEIRQTYPRAYEPWKQEEDEQLRQRYQQGATIKNLVDEFQRQPSGIRSRLKKLGLL